MPANENRNINKQIDIIDIQRVQREIIIKFLK